MICSQNPFRLNALAGIPTCRDICKLAQVSMVASPFNYGLYFATYEPFKASLLTDEVPSIFPSTTRGLSMASVIVRDGRVARSAPSGERSVWNRSSVLVSKSPIEWIETVAEENQNLQERTAT